MFYKANHVKKDLQELVVLETYGFIQLNVDRQ